MGSLRIMLVYWDAVLFHLACMIFGGRRRNVRRVKGLGTVVGHFAFLEASSGGDVPERMDVGLVRGLC